MKKISIIIKAIYKEFITIVKLSKLEWLEMAEILFLGISINSIYGLINDFDIKDFFITFMAIYGVLKVKKIKKELWWNGFY